MIEEQLEQDIKTALLGGDSNKVGTLRLLKSVILKAKVDSGKRDSGLTNDEVITILSKEAKTRQESASLYATAGENERANTELAEKALIQAYLPVQLSEEETTELVQQVIKETGATGQADMGKVIAGVRQKAGAGADGALIANITKEKLGL